MFYAGVLVVVALALPVHSQVEWPTTSRYIHFLVSTIFFSFFLLTLPYSIILYTLRDTEPREILKELVIIMCVCEVIGVPIAHQY